VKNVIITGASGGLGSVVTKYFLDNDYRVFASVSSEKSKQSLPQHPNLHTNIVDLADEKQAAGFVKEIIEKQQTIDACLLLAGGFAAGSLESSDVKAITGQLGINFFTAYNIARPVFQQMKTQKNGRIVFVGARPALAATPGKNMVAYALSKSLLFKLAEMMNDEAKGTDVTASVIVPSTIDTAVNRSSMPNADPAKWVKPESIAGILHFIVSNDDLREPILKVYHNA